MDYLWRQKYNPGNFPVLAFTGAPASFPVQIENKELQKYLIWNDEMIKKAKEFIKTKLPAGAFVGIHLRNGIDWVSDLIFFFLLIIHSSLILFNK